jgi:hypothetical protein
MYQRDVALIKEHAYANASGLYDVVEFVIGTINMPLSRVHTQRESIAVDGFNSKWLSQMKVNGLAYAQSNAQRLHGETMRILDKHDIHSLDAAHKVTLNFVDIPGIGMVKAAFIAQMLGLNAACLDRHNVRAMGVSEDAFKLDKTAKPDVISRKVRDYLKVCRRKGSEYWWNTWCEFVANRGGMNKSLPTADDVSKYHSDTVMMFA